MKIYRNPDISIPLSFSKDFLRHSLILFQQKKGKKTPVLSSFGNMYPDNKFQENIPLKS